MQNYQVILLAAGFGQNLYPVTESYSKHLLPIVNKPVIAYALEYLEKYEATDITIVCNEKNEAGLKSFVKNQYKKLNSKTTLDFYTPENVLPVVDLIPVMAEENILKKDFILFGGDIITEINLHKVIDFHYKNRSDMTTVLMKQEGKDKKIPFSSNNKKEYMVYAIEEGTNRMIHASSSYDMKESGLKFNTTNLVRHPRIMFESKTIEANILIFKHSIVKFLEKYSNKFLTVTEDFVPFLAENQYNPAFLETLKEEKSSEDRDTETFEVNDYFEKTVESEKFVSFRPFAYITTEFCMRINSISEYHQANLEAAGKASKYECYKQTLTQGEGTNIDKASKVQRSIVGANVNIGPGCKIVNSIIFDGATIEANNTLQNCMIGKDAHIKPKSVLKEVIVSSNATVNPETNLTKENVM